MGTSLSNDYWYSVTGVRDTFDAIQYVGLPDNIIICKKGNKLVYKSLGIFN